MGCGSSQEAKPAVTPAAKSAPAPPSPTTSEQRAEAEPLVPKAETAQAEAAQANAPAGQPASGESLDVEAAKKTAGDIAKDSKEFGTKTMGDISKTWEQMRSAKFSAENDPEANTPLKKGIKFAMIYLVKPLIIIIMIYAFIVQQLYRVYKILPMNLLQAIFGIGLCFFGGIYFMSIAAAEAFRNFGGMRVIDEFVICWDQAMLVKAANELDDEVDADKNGTVDVQEMSYNELLSHKAKVAMVAIEQPDRLQKALEYLFTAYVAVVATLKVQFARTVAVALGIADMLVLPSCQLFGPMLAVIYGKDLQHWVEPTITTIVKLTAVIVASYIQAIISAFYSGLRGGRMFGTSVAYGLMPYLGPYLTKCGVQDPFDPEQSYIDEMIGFPLAAAGFYYQFTSGFVLPFPYNLIMLPCTIVEWAIRWDVYT
mmetsp:Transcript_21507/g.38569  ORF Transcript_21507/g.38569 Transcript_21507/m.38569 type:complete len:426 (+) Transcript_21507:86-1363(+)